MVNDQPKWIQEIAERESKATKGPWEVFCGNSVFCGEECIAVIPEGSVSADDTAFIAYARTDVPRLVEASFGLAEALAALILYVCVAGSGCHVCDTDDDRCYLDDRCYVRGAERALAKYRGEVDADA